MIGSESARTSSVRSSGPEELTVQPSLRNELDVAGEEALYLTLRRFWHPVAYANEVDPGPKRVVLLDQELVIARLGDRICAFPDLCAHQGTALSLGRVDEGRLRCYHGWAYDPDGRCTTLPARPGGSIQRRARLQRYSAAERAGLIWVCLSGEPIFPLPEFPEFADSTYRVLTLPAHEWRCSAARRVENFVDFSHFAWVHDGLLGSRDAPEVPDHDVWREGGELRFGEGFRDHERDPISPEVQERGGLPYLTGAVLSDKSYRLFMPFSVWFNRRLPDDHHYVMFFSASPVGSKVTRGFTFLARNYELGVAEDEKFLSFALEIFEQDRPVVESQRPEELPFDLSAELHIKGADEVSIDYRRWLVELTKAYGPVAERRPAGS